MDRRAKSPPFKFQIDSEARGELDQIQFLLGHVSIQTEQSLGCKQKLRFAVNDKIGIEP